MHGYIRQIVPLSDSEAADMGQRNQGNRAVRFISWVLQYGNAYLPVRILLLNMVWATYIQEHVPGTKFTQPLNSIVIDDLHCFLMQVESCMME